MRCLSRRRDGRISVVSNTDILLLLDFELAILIDLFISKGLSQVEMIILSGVHTMDIVHYDAFSKQLDTATLTLEVKYATPVEMTLVMTVEPRFGGQKFIRETMDKVCTLRKEFPNLDIELSKGYVDKYVKVYLNLRGGSFLVVAQRFV
ncbi:hypothetical protein ZIOFF_059091 [Zingiber officinale]|uniref:Plant heme peroxidase family profile domain-containing protein n=1 Tax=Zingiber officinale TaxID=94328 RepID=A0A8J5KB42_ZINOF|nr:hypothetical protein ZIOFF_059091 [Zingiber officinale]